MSTETVPQEAIDTALRSFRSLHYVRHNMRRLEHLASLGLPNSGLTVLEPGAGIGDHTCYYSDRGCSTTSIEPRPENAAIYSRELSAERYPCSKNVELILTDYTVMETISRSFDIVHAYGFLYHVADPARAIAAMAKCTRRFLALETCVSFGSDAAIHLVEEAQWEPTQSAEGKGCRPTRPWIMAELQKHFEHVYVTRTQPAHEEFPTDWAVDDKTAPAKRAVFVASRKPLASGTLLTELPDVQSRHTT